MTIAQSIIKGIKERANPGVQKQRSDILKLGKVNTGRVMYS